MKLRISDLEKQLDHKVLPSSMTSLGSPDHLSTLNRSSKRHWEGVWMNGPEVPQGQLYGPLSSFFFISRLNSFLGISLQQSRSAQSLLPNSVSKVFLSPEYSTAMATGAPSVEYLPRDQECYFLDLFWQTYQATIPILDEAGFKQHYESLWRTGTGTNVRALSPIVDIIVALCMQYGMGFVPRISAQGFSKADIDHNDASIAGHHYYHRCQALLTLELERPSITTLQCYVYSIMYLQNASFVNTAHVTLAKAIRTAHALGLHQEPPDYLPESQKGLRRRLWWACFAIDTKLSAALGRPWLAPISQISCRFPADDQEAQKNFSRNLLSPNSDVTWLSYQVRCIKLVAVTQEVTRILSEAGSGLTESYGEDVYSNSELLEKLAMVLSQNLRGLQSWIEDVPEGLQIKRKSQETSFSPGRAMLLIDHWIPPWLQFQRVLLELNYHDQILNLYRPFLRFSSPSGMARPLADSHAISCLNHAIANTSVLHQYLTETNTLHGWHEAYKMQWNAAISIAGFCFGYPVSPSTPAARSALNLAINVFNIMSEIYAVAASAANVMQDLATKVDIFISRFQPPAHIPQQPPQQPSVQANAPKDIPIDNPVSHSNGADGDASNTVPTEATNVTERNILNGESDLQFPLDSFADLEMLMSDGNMTLLWEDFINNS